MAREPDHIVAKRRALGEQLAVLRKSAELTQGQLAKSAFCDRTTVAHIESGRARADDRFWSVCDEAVGADGSLLTTYHDLVNTKRTHEADVRRALAAGSRRHAQRLTDEYQHGEVTLPGTRHADDCSASAATPAPPLDADYVEGLHERIRELVVMDGKFGGDSTSRLALSLFRAVRRKLGKAECSRRVERDLHAAAGELGEVTGWLLFDAGEHDLARDVNHEALHLSRMAGDSRMELLTLQNMSMHAGYLGHAAEARRIARMVLETRDLSPRMRALFHTREARALALGGADYAARDTFRKAHSLYLEGVRDDDPAWSWWITDPELSWHQGMINADSAQWSSAIEAFHESVTQLPPHALRGRYVHLACLLDAQMRAASWDDARQTTERILPLVDEIGSTRSAEILRGTLAYVEEDAQALTRIREPAEHLRRSLVGAGYQM
ncbi:helix-turn-helix transcriptional regulator [Saccharomonospora iraqiensis]|uniref:helix-turn-helix transcriptional regulator n=1 Tax=Saccharomonospora iraqiensis TaxID=52698 RepID=UPI00022E896C|nr:helix-turn-helix transcriptional regulator [Saccharomonospora iraqiensis]